MSQYTLGAGLVLPEDRGLYSLVDDRVRVTPELVVLSRPAASGWQDITYRELDAHARRVAAVLLHWGVGAGDRVGILGRTSYEWVVADLAVLAIGAITVPIFPTASAAQIAHIVADSGMTWCFAETPEHQELVAGAAAGALRAAPWPLADLDSLTASDDTARADGEVPAAGDGGAGEFERRRDAVRADSIATIVYTSGTTGMPKGCILTHGNLFASSANTVEHTGGLFRVWPPEHTVGTGADGNGADDSDVVTEQAATLLCLPLAHVFGRTILVACLYAGTRTGLLSAVTDLLPAMAGFRPTVLALVPYGLEKIRKGLRAAVDADTELAAVAAGLAQVGTGTDEPGGRPDEALLARVGAVFGGRLTHVISGGASLDSTTAAYYRGLGVHILNCYGLTEAATAVTVNQPETNRVGTVGQPIPGTTVGIAPDGEVLVAGPNVSPGYWRTGQDPLKADTDPLKAGTDPLKAGTDPLTAGAAAQDGTDAAPRWLYTGDLGRLDADGYLVITGRRKEILVTSGGKNVTPTLLEDRMRLHPLVADCMVVGEGRPFVAALVTLEPAVLAKLAAEAGLDLGADRWWEHPAVAERLRDAVDDTNSLVSRAESIRRIRVLPTQFTIADGHLTPSMKLRRAQIEAAFAAEIDELYTTAPEPAGPAPTEPATSAA
ncbi:long-chain fatty acid--CoA ligase [Parafrankia sp. EUN1f]|uniref:AMP-dependent synthetase/ligase n=1 Tax=Parafrankia sp. EUN1f TaxID=102897 RepID=UPI0001C46BE1|nr:AMP-dependent synthetase and ligase [Parafrankia sp. EUN1f]